MALHDTIRARRKELGLSQEYLAEQLGISRQAVAKWEAGQSRPTAANLAALAAVLELPVSALVDPVGAQPLSSAHPGEKEKNIKWRLRRSGAYILLNTGWDGYSSGLYGIAPLYWLAILAAGLVLLFMTSVEREKKLKLQNMPKVQIAEPLPVKRTVKKYKVFLASSQALLATFYAAKHNSCFSIGVNTPKLRCTLLVL